MNINEKLKIIFNLIMGKNVRAHNKLSKFLISDTTNIVTNIDKKDSSSTNPSLVNKSKLLRKGLFKLRKLTWRKTNIYSAAFGKKGLVIENNEFESKVICFCDSQLKNPNVETWYPIFWNQNLKKLSLIHKYIAPLANGNMDYGKKFIWIDSRIEISEKLVSELFLLLDKNNLILFSHYERSDLFDELKAIYKANRASAEEVNAAAELLRSENFKSNLLFETGVVAFKLNEEISKVFREVYGFCERYIARDQIAMPYILSKHEITPFIYDGGNTNLREVSGIKVKSW